jgi:hypothetical protein
MKTLYFFVSCILLCGQSGDSLKVFSETALEKHTSSGQGDSKQAGQNSSKVIHIIVALCDNKYQGIVPVGAKIGNGQDPDNNLYWGCAYGIRSYFKKSAEWKLLKLEKKNGHILERAIFRHATKDFYLVADAYDGQYIQTATEDFLAANAGTKKETIAILGPEAQPNGAKLKTIGIYGNAQLLSYIGHDGLMDFDLDENYANTDGQVRDCIILACISKRFFAPYIKNAKSRPLVWTTQLMAPEAYTVHDAISGYILGETPQQIQNRAAKAYSKYQKCSLKAANNLLVTGF